MTTRFDEFRAAHHGTQPLLLPNAWDHASARALLAAGFGTIGTTSLGVAASHGLPDATGAAREETVALAVGLSALDCLITVDIEAGFSDDPSQVAELVAGLARHGVVGVNIEDGRPDGSLTDPKRLAAKISTIKATSPDVFVNARTDAYWLGVPEAQTEALARATRYQEAGADGIFVPGASTAEAIDSLVTAIEVPVNVLFSPPHLTVAELAELGVARVSTGSLLFRAAMGAVIETMAAVNTGRTLPAGIPSYADIQSLAG